MFYDFFIKLVKFVKHYIFIDIDKFMVLGEIVGRINLIFIYIRIFLRVVALLLNLNLSVFMISIIL